MGKKGRGRQNREKKNSKTSTQYDDGLSSDDMHDEIDACNFLSVSVSSMLCIKY